MSNINTTPPKQVPSEIISAAEINGFQPIQIKIPQNQSKYRVISFIILPSARFVTGLTNHSDTAVHTSLPQVRASSPVTLGTRKSSTTNVTQQ